MGKSWYCELKEEFEKPYMQKLSLFLKEERAEGKIIYPLEELIFNAFCQTSFDEVKVVILGQDPYHGAGQAHGLAFSVPEGVTAPPSLINIFKELINDVGIKMPKTGCLIPWTRQGVLLLNATLTVRAGEPRSHYGRGWEVFTDAAIAKLVKKREKIVFLLWGKSAEEKCDRVLKDSSNHLVLKAAHPSFYSAAGFFGCRHFSETNHFLEGIGKTPIDWQIP